MLLLLQSKLAIHLQALALHRHLQPRHQLLLLFQLHLQLREGNMLPVLVLSQCHHLPRAPEQATSQAFLGFGNLLPHVQQLTKAISWCRKNVNFEGALSLTEQQLLQQQAGHCMNCHCRQLGSQALVETQGPMRGPSISALLKVFAKLLSL